MAFEVRPPKSRNVTRRCFRQHASETAMAVVSKEERKTGKKGKKRRRGKLIGLITLTPFPS